MIRFKSFKYILEHKIVIFKLWFKYDTKVSLYRVIMHDLIKMFMVLILDYKYVNVVHRKYARHHNRKTDNDFYESYLDWTSARYTKKDKQLDALETCEKLYPQYLQKSIEHYNIVKFK